MLKSFSAALAAMMLMLFSCAASAADANKTPFRIAMIDPLAGPMANIGQPIIAALRFDAKRLNKQGGINGHKIEIVGLDNSLSPKKSLIQLQKAADQGIHYITQGASSAVASTLLNGVIKHNRRNPDDRILFLNWASVKTALTEQRCSFWFFRFSANEAMTVNTLTDWIASQDDIHRVFLLNQDYSFGHDLSESAREMLSKKDPDLKIVGNIFIPLNQVKDFTPYISRIAASGADAVITGNYGSDMTLLVKAAADAGLDVKFLTYYGNTAGTVSQLGEKGVGRLYLISGTTGYPGHPVMAKREVQMYKETGWDYGNMRTPDMLAMLKRAAEKADSIDPTQVAYALEGLQYDSLVGPVTMRAQDHQLLTPLFISVLEDNMKYGLEGTDGLSFKTIDEFSAQQVALPTHCEMRRPAK